MNMRKSSSLNDLCVPSTYERGEGSNASLRIEQRIAFQNAMRLQNWKLAESLIFSAVDVETLNDFLDKTMEFIWFLKSRHELEEITGLMKQIVSTGACDLNRAIVKSSFLASCLSVYGGLTKCLESNLAIMFQRLHDRVQKSKLDEVLKAKVGKRVENMTKWVMQCADIRALLFQNKSNGNLITIDKVQLQLSGFKAFLDIAGNNLSRKEFREAFVAACFPLTYNEIFKPGWRYGVSAYLIQCLLTMLVEGGADNVNQSFLQATQFGSIEPIRIFLQLAQKKNLSVNVELALEFACQLGKIKIIECLVEEGHATSFLSPLCFAVKQGRLPVVQWFVSRGCQNENLAIALVVAAHNNQVEITDYILHNIPLHFLALRREEIIKNTYILCGDSQGVSLLLQLNYLGDSDATYTVADNIAQSHDVTLDHELKVFLQEQWSEAAFLDGMNAEKNHYVNLMRILKRSESVISLRDLPSPLLMAIAFLPLYKECLKAKGRMLTQRLRGQLVEVTGRLTNGAVGRGSQFSELLAVLESHLSFLVHTS